MSKKRNHKAVINRRRSRISLSDRKEKEKAWEKILNYYTANSDTIPMPTLTDALSTQNIKDSKAISLGVKHLTNYFNEYIDSQAKENKLTIGLPDDTISFIIPLDFYIPLPEPYNAVSISTDENDINTVNCTTIVSDVTAVGASAVKTSYLIASVCSKELGEITNLENKAVFEAFEAVVKECNNVIAGYQTIPTRHNHYMHNITVQSCPQQVNAFIFNRKTGVLIVEGEVSFHENVHSEIFHSRPIEEDEINQFVASHTNKTFTDDRIFELVSKYNQATNVRCFGNNEDAVILSDSFVELTLGYLLCEIKTAEGQSRESVIKTYTSIRTTGELITKLANSLDMSNSQFKNIIGYSKWFTNCRKLRNDITHRFMVNSISTNESLNALFYSGRLIANFCQLLQSKYTIEDFPEFFDKLEILTSASRLVDLMHQNAD